MNKEQALPTLQQQEKLLEKKRTKQGLDQHFKLFNDLLKLKYASYTKTALMLIIAFIHHFLSQIRQYKSLINIHYQTESTILDQMIDFCTYFDIQGLLRLDITINYIMLSVFLLATVGNTILYFILYVLQGDGFRVRKRFLGKKFVQLSEWYVWLLHYPAMIVFFENIVCGPTINCTKTSVREIIISLSVLGVFFGTINNFFLSVFFHNNSSQKKDYLNTENSLYILAFQLFRTIQAFLVSFSQNEYGYLWVMLIVIFIGYSYFLLNCLFFNGYLAFATTSVRNTFQILLTIMVSTSFSMIVDELYRYGQFRRILIIFCENLI